MNLAPFLQACGGRMRLQTVNKFGLSGELTLAARYHKSLLPSYFMSSIHPIQVFLTEDNFALDNG
jgi:hypothetical protein